MAAGRALISSTGGWLRQCRQGETSQRSGAEAEAQLGQRGRGKSKEKDVGGGFIILVISGGELSSVMLCFLSGFVRIPFDS